jgi:hypothetical protein
MSVEAPEDLYDPNESADQFAQASPSEPWTGPYEMSRVDWRWAAQRGFFDPKTKLWIAAAGGYEAYARQRAQLKATRRGGKTAANSDPFFAPSSQLPPREADMAAAGASRSWEAGGGSSGRDGARAAGAGEAAAWQDGWSVERPLAFRTCSIVFDQVLQMPPHPPPPPNPRRARGGGSERPACGREGRREGGRERERERWGWGAASGGGHRGRKGGRWRGEQRAKGNRGEGRGAR